MKETFESVWLRCCRNHEEGEAQGLLDSITLSGSYSCLFHTVLLL